MKNLKELKKPINTLAQKLNTRNYTVLGEAPLPYGAGTVYRVRPKSFNENHQFIQNHSKPGHTTIIATPSVATNGAEGVGKIKSIIDQPDKSSEVMKELHTPGHISAYRPGSKPGEFTTMVSHSLRGSSLKKDIETTMAKGVDSYIAVIPNEYLPNADSSRKVNSYQIGTASKSGTGDAKPDNCATAAGEVLLGKRGSINPLMAFRQITSSATREAIVSHVVSEDEAEKAMDKNIEIEKSLGIDRSFEKVSEDYKVELAASKKTICPPMTTMGATARPKNSNIEESILSPSSDVPTMSNMSPTNNVSKP